MDEQEQYEQFVRENELRAAEERTRGIQQEVMLRQQDASMVQEQLDLTDELESIEYLLKGYTKKFDRDTGEKYWAKPTDPDVVVLSNYGVQLILDTVQWYLNKNTLLSNYDEDTIRQKMEDFSSDLNDDIFMSYEKVFKYPTVEECKEEIRKRIQKKVDLRKFAHELAGLEVDEEQIKKQVILEIEDRIDVEMENIREQKMKDKLKRFAMIMRKIQDAIHSTYNRAFGGQERKTLREHIHISETKGGPMVQAQPKMGLLDHFRRR